MFISFEGPEGCGKSTQVELLASKLRANGKTVVTLREPGGTEIGEEIRAIFKRPRSTAVDPLTELFLICASRAQLVSSVIQPALKRGDVVICDRYVHSTIAYQGYGRQLLEDCFVDDRWDAIISAGCKGKHPDLVFMLGLPLDECKRRMTSRQTTDRLEQELDAFHARIHTRFSEGWSQRLGRVVRLDATLSKEAIHEKVMKIYAKDNKDRDR